MSSLNEEGRRFQLDEVLGQLGTFGRHQVATMAMLALVYATNSMYNVNYVFAVEDVNYRCRIPLCDNESSVFEAPWLTSRDVKQLQYHPPLHGCAEFNTSELRDCDDWLYEAPHSFMAEFGLAGEDWKVALVGTTHCLSKMLGQLVQGHISDRFGRKTATVVSGTLGAVIGITKSFAVSYWIYLALEALEAAIGDAMSPVFMLSIENIEKKHVVLFQMILLNCYTGGLILVPVIAWAVPYWRHFLRVIYAPTLLILTYSLFLDESIRWLFSKGKRARAVSLINKIAKRNNVQLDLAMLNKMNYIGEESKNDLSNRKVLIMTLKSNILMKRFLVCLMWWLTITVNNYGMMISSVFIDGNKYINFTLLILMDVPANVFFWLALSKYKRKIPLFVAFLVGGLFCISQPLIPKRYAWVGLCLLMLFELLATFSCNIVNMYTLELFPTYTRNSVQAACSSFGRLGALLAPQIPLLITVWSGLPPFIFGVLSLVSGALTLLMPETARCELPDTVSQAENIGRTPLLKKPSTEENNPNQKFRIINDPPQASDYELDASE